MARIGRRHKKIMKGVNKYIKNITATPNTQPSAKRQLTKYKRQGSDTVKETIATPAIHPS